MRALRHHLLSLVAVALALAAGVVWGSGPLSEKVNATVEAETRELNSEQQALKAQIARLEEQARLGEKFVGSVSAPLAEGRLDGRTVSIFVAPGAEAALVERTGKALRGAGAEITNTISLTGAYLDPTKAVSPLEDLALRLVPPGVTFPSGASAIDRVSTVLARSTVTSVAADSGQVDEAGAAVLAGLQEIGALKVKGHPGARSELAVFVLGSSETTAGKKAGTSGAEVLVGLAVAVDRGSRGLVVTGPSAAADRDGVIARLRKAGPADKPEAVVSTVDVGVEQIGSLTVVLALTQNLQGESGHYGTGPGADALLPPLARAPVS